MNDGHSKEAPVYRIPKYARNVLLALSGLLATGLVWCSMASAMSLEYGDCTLRGGNGVWYSGCTLAPDNDIRQTWDYIQNSWHLDVVSSGLYAFHYWRSDTGAYAYYRFQLASGGYWCEKYYVNDNRPYGGAYEDGDVNNVAC